MKINILGWYGKKNVGDEAFRYAHEILFAGHTFSFITPPQQFTNPDILILGGGAVVAPFYLENNLPNCPRYALGIDISYESEVDLLAKYNFKGVMVRNSTDLPDMVRKLQCPVKSIPDLAFILKPIGQDILSRYKRHPNKRTIGVFATDYVNPAIDRPVGEFANTAFDFKIKLARQLDFLIRDGWEVMLIPCATAGYGDDRRMNLDLLAFMQYAELATNVMDTLNPQEMVDLISQLDQTLCMRFHAHIFSIIAGTPFVSIQYTRKVRLLLEENGLLNATCCTYNKDGWFPQFQMGDVRECIKNVTAGNPKEKFLEISRRNYDKLQTVVNEVRSEWLV